MRMKTMFKPENVTNPSRPAISEPYLQGDRLVATDGRAIVAVPVEREEGDADGYIPATALAIARKWGRKLGATSLKAEADKLTTPEGATFPRPALGTFPQWEQVLPAKDRREIRISFDAALLLALAEAIGTTGGNGQKIVTLGLAVDADGKLEDRAAIRLETREGVTAVFMPCRI
jgi:hypothetical protein